MLASVGEVRANPHQANRLVVHLDVALRQRDLVDFKRYPGEAQLSSDVHPSQLHIHGNDLHSTHTSGVILTNNLCEFLTAPPPPPSLSPLISRT